MNSYSHPVEKNFPSSTAKAVAQFIQWHVWTCIYTHKHIQQQMLLGSDKPLQYTWQKSLDLQQNLDADADKTLL